MGDSAFAQIEAGLAFGRDRAIVLAMDTANARRPGFIAFDVQPAANGFGSVVAHALGSGASATIENSMAASAQNSVRYRALADQERAMLREFRSAADDARR
jgi:flagellar basal body rod protein FlgB